MTTGSESEAGFGLPAQPDLVPEDARQLLEHGELDVQGRLVDASNATLFCVATLDGVSAMCVHKPVAGERPLWDFPEGTLAGREVATYVVSEATGWDLVPPTVMRDGPYGPGMCQLWVDVDDEVDLGLLVRSEHPDLRRMVVLDAVVNNADRKGGHLLAPSDGRVQGVDHGVTFSDEDKLRTVLWGWSGEALRDEAVDVLAGLEPELDVRRRRSPTTLAPLVTRREITRTRFRVRRLLRDGIYPHPRGEWPPVPWPAF